MEHHFTIIIDRTAFGEQQMLEFADSLADAGCLDAAVGGHAEGMEAIFARDGASLVVAIESAVQQIERAGFIVKRIEVPRDSLKLQSSQ
jgi:hypothetical protein